MTYHKIKMALFSIFCSLTLLANGIKLEEIEKYADKTSSVTALEFANSGIESIPDEVFEFIHVTSIDLSNNGIIKISNQFKVFEALERIDLSNNPLLDVAQLGLVLESLPRLKSINISGCNISILPSRFGNIEQLEILDLSNNAIQHLPGAFKEFSNLKRIDLSNNDLKKLDYCPNFWWGLKEIDISNNSELDVNRVLFSIGFYGEMDKITIGNNAGYELFDKSVSGIKVESLVIKDDPGFSFGSAFVKSKISYITFENCILRNSNVRALSNTQEIAEVVIINSEPVKMNLNHIRRLVLAETIFPKDEVLKSYKGLKELDASNMNLTAEQKTILKNKLPSTKLIFKNEVFEEKQVYKAPIPTANLPFTSYTYQANDTKCIKTENVQIDIPANAFLDANGEVYKGEINVNYREFFDPIATAMAGVPMDFKAEDGAKQFYSSGMLEVTAEDAAGNQLISNPENPILANIKTLQPQNNNELFTLNKETGFWEYLEETPEVSEQFKLEQKIVDSINGLDIEDLVQLREMRPLYRLYLDRNRDLKSLDIKFKAYDTRKKVRIYSKGSNRYYYDNPCVREKLIAKYSFTIDTSNINGFYKILKSIDRQTKKAISPFFSLKNYRYELEDIPRFISDIRLEPNYDTDNFLLKFIYKGKELEFPVSLTKSDYKKPLKEVKQIERLSKKNIAVSRIEVKNDKKINKLIKKYLLDEEAVIRARVTALSLAKIRPVFGLASWSNTSRFELNLGMTNLDYLKSIIAQSGESFKPGDLKQYKYEFEDENGKQITMVNNLRVLDHKYNTAYTGRLGSVYYLNHKAAIAILFISESEIGLCSIAELNRANSRSAAKVKVLNVEGLEFDAIKILIDNEMSSL